MPKSTSLIVTRTPLRISLAGGGTDLPVFYERGSYGAVLSTTIDKYVYVTLKCHDGMFGAPIRLNYSETEQVSTVSEIKNEIARECLKFLGVEPPIYISTVADIPAASGLGSSSAFCVGLLHALHIYRGEHPSAGQLAEEAAEVEINRLGRPIGKQDHYASAYGGFNLFQFLPTGGVSVEPQHFQPDGLDRFFRHALLMWTGVTRNAARVLGEQQANTPDRLGELEMIRDQAHELQAVFANGFHADQLGLALNDGWRLKRRLASAITTPTLDFWYERAIDAGAYGGKLCGAGGGGFFLFMVKPEKRPDVLAALTELREVRIGYEPQGSRVLVPQFE
jgi:D-glycero-alpha-D-manno-heptose-7-phosphate kinase